METFIKYKRFQGKYSENELQAFFDKLISEGWEIIYYKEKPDGFIINIIVVCGKKQKNL